MNRFTVDWTATAEDQLADIWNKHPADARPITQTSNAIDVVLAADPLGYGEEVSEGLRKITLPPLTAFYSVNEAKRTVEVDAVKFTP